MEVGFKCKVRPAGRVKFVLKQASDGAEAARSCSRSTQET